MYIDRPVPAFGFTLYCIVLLTVLFAGRLLYKKKDHCSTRFIYINTFN